VESRIVKTSTKELDRTMKSNHKATVITSPVRAALLGEKIVLPALRSKVQKTAKQIV
jgi:hypothetical protein